MEELQNIRDLLKQEIEKEKETLLQSNSKGAIKFFLDSISADIKYMLDMGFSLKQQLDIINRSSEKNIKYSTYIRYVRKHLKNGQRKNLNSMSHGRDKIKFSHEAFPNLEELY